MCNLDRLETKKFAGFGGLEKRKNSKNFYPPTFICNTWLFKQKSTKLEKASMLIKIDKLPNFLILNALAPKTACHLQKI